MNRSKIVFFVTLLRGLFAAILGIALIFQPDKTRPILVNFMGVYWLVSGTVSLRYGSTGRRARGFPILAGIVGVIAGLAILSRTATLDYVAEEIVFTIIGTMVVLTGILHMFGGFRTESGERRRWSWTSFFLGLFEAVLGVLLIIEPLERGSFVYTAATIWALIGGFILISDAFRLRRQSRQIMPDEPFPSE